MFVSEPNFIPESVIFFLLLLSLDRLISLVFSTLPPYERRENSPFYYYYGNGQKMVFFKSRPTK